jgi:YjbE family integral membrane protein
MLPLPKQGPNPETAMNLFEPEALTALLGVIGIDLVLAGDNAIVIGMAAAGLPKDQRTKAIIIGVIAATVLRIVFAVAATRLLVITGLTLAGGILLLWVCWKMWRELRQGHEAAAGAEALANCDLNADGAIAKGAPRKSFAQAAWQIVLAVAGAAKEHPSVLVFGLILSVALMGLAASFIAGLLSKHRWIAFVGLAIIMYVAGHMIYEGMYEVMPVVAG